METSLRNFFVVGGRFIRFPLVSVSLGFNWLNCTFWHCDKSRQCGGQTEPAVSCDSLQFFPRSKLVYAISCAATNRKQVGCDYFFYLFFRGATLDFAFSLAVGAVLVVVSGAATSLQTCLSLRLSAQLSYPRRSVAKAIQFECERLNASRLL